MRKFLSLLMGLGLLCPLDIVRSQNIANKTANTPAFTTYQEATQYAFSNLDLSRITTGVLYDRTFKNAHLDIFQPSETSNAGHWKQAYFELYNASGSTGQMLTADQLDDLIYEASYNKATVPLGVISAEFNTLNYDAVETTVSGTPYQLKTGYNASQTFVEKQVMVAAPLISIIPKGTTGFTLPKWATISFGTNYVTSISAKFGDGNPIRTFSPGSNLNQQATFNTPGEKTLEFTIYLSNGTQKTARATIQVSDMARENNTGNRILDYPRNDNISKVDSADIWASIPFQGYEETSAFPGFGQYLTYYAEGRTQIRKPVIIIDGFDPGDSRSAKYVYETRMRYFDNGNRQFGDDLRKTPREITTM